MEGDEVDNMSLHWHSKTDVRTERPESLGCVGANESNFIQCNTPTDVFMVFMDVIIDDLVYQTNLYGTQNDRTLKITKDEMLVFFGINFFMGYHELPAWKDYWSSSPDLGVKFVSDAMSRNTFQKILQNLHCNDNTSLPSNNKDKLFKLRPIIDKLNTSFRNHYFGTRQLSVDESMVKFKGRSTLKQYNPMKPIKRGYKIWSMADQNGYMLAFKIYQGKEESINPEFSSLGLGERVVLELTKSVWNQYREIYFDNFFSSTKLLQQLKLQKTLACGTVRINRKGLPKKMMLDKEMKRGMSDSKFLVDGISFFKWMDNKPVHLISNFHGSEITSVKRKAKDGSAVTVPCPSVVSDYNKYMGGVDHADRLRALYNIDRKSPKWWHRLFFGLIDIMFVNSYVVYTTLFNKISVLEYRRSVVQGLLTNQSLKTKNSPAQKQKNNKRRKTGFSVSRDVRTGNTGIHWPCFVKERARCEVCSSKAIESRPHSKCSHCNVFLCCNEKKNCFSEFHEK